MSRNCLPLDARLLLNVEQNEPGNKGGDEFISIQNSNKTASIDGLRELKGVMNINREIKSLANTERRKSVACTEYFVTKNIDVEYQKHGNRRRQSIATLLDMYSSANSLKSRTKTQASHRSEPTLDRFNKIANIVLDDDGPQDANNGNNIPEDSVAISNTLDEIRPRVKSSTLHDPPDGGWAWVMTFSAFIVGVILDGISFSFGILFIPLLAHFEESKSLTSWIISVLNGTYLCIGW